MEPTEHFGIYYGYIQRLFQKWVSPFKNETAGVAGPDQGPTRPAQTAPSRRQSIEKLQQ